MYVYRYLQSLTSVALQTVCCRACKHWKLAPYALSQHCCAPQTREQRLSLHFQPCCETLSIRNPFTAARSSNVNMNEAASRARRESRQVTKGCGHPRGCCPSINDWQWISTKNTAVPSSVVTRWITARTPLKSWTQSPQWKSHLSLIYPAVKIVSSYQPANPDSILARCG